jgi:hypothetical protein
MESIIGRTPGTWLSTSGASQEMHLILPPIKDKRTRLPAPKIVLFRLDSFRYATRTTQSKPGLERPSGAT